MKWGPFHAPKKGIFLKFWAVLYHYSYKRPVHRHRLHGQHRHMNLIDSIGTLAAVLTTISFFPQAWHTFRTRDVSGISASMYSFFTVGVGLWIGYGVLLGAWPIIIANAITFSMALTILTMKLRYR